MREGIPFWDEDITYDNGAFVSHDGLLWVASTAENTGNEPSEDSTIWRRF